MSKINLNGKIISGEKPAIKVGNRSFHYGDAIFENIRIINGEMCNFNQHYERLQQGFDTLKFKIDDELKPAALFLKLQKLIEENKILGGGWIRITISRAGNEYFLPQTDKVDYLIEAYPLKNNLFELNKTGLNVDLFTKFTKNRSDISNNLRTTNSLHNILIGLYARENNLDDCIVLNDAHRLCEAISSNLFLYKNNTIYTPEIGEGCFPGVMRKQIIRIAKEKGIVVVEGTLVPNHLLQVDGVFLTDSINGIKWVMSYKQKRYFNKISTMLVNALNEVYSK